MTASCSPQHGSGSRVHICIEERDTAMPLLACLRYPCKPIHLKCSLLRSPLGHLDIFIGPLRALPNSSKELQKHSNAMAVREWPRRVSMCDYLEILPRKPPMLCEENADSELLSFPLPPITYSFLPTSVLLYGSTSPGLKVG